MYELEGVCAPSGAGGGNVHFEIYIFVLVIYTVYYTPTIWGYLSFGGCLGAAWGNVHFTVFVYLYSILFMFNNSENHY